MTILVDMDNVIADLLGAWTKYLWIKYDVYVNKEDIKEWDMEKAYPTLTHEQIFSALSDKALWEQMKPVEGSVKIVKELAKRGDNELFIVTAGHYDTMGVRGIFLKKYFPFINYRNVMVAPVKQIIAGDVLIDDKPKNLIGGGYKKILFDAPHNRDFNAEKFNMKRAKSWIDVYDIIQDYDRGDLIGLCNQELWE